MRASRFAVCRAYLASSLEVFYPISSLPPELAKVILYNPMFHYVDFFRQLVLTGGMPNALTVSMCIIWSIVSLGLGLIVFQKYQKNFILYV